MAGLYDLLADGKIERSESHNCVEFLINDSSLFSTQGINTLRNERHSGLIKCSQSKQNGKKCLRYFIFSSDFKPISSRLDKMNAQNFMQCLVNLKSVFDIDDFDVYDGFFNKNNVAIDFNDVYVDINSSRVYILYIPLTEASNYDDSCERLLGEAIQKAIKFNYNLLNQATSKLYELLNSKVSAFDAIGEVALKYNIRPVEYELISNVTVIEESPFSQGNNSAIYDDESTMRREFIEKQEQAANASAQAVQNFSHPQGYPTSQPYVPYQPEPQSYQPASNLNQTSSQSYQIASNLNQTSPQSYQIASNLNQTSPQSYQPASNLNQPTSQSYQPASVIQTSLGYNQASQNDGTEIIGYNSASFYLVSKKTQAKFDLHMGTTSVGRNSNVDIDLGFIGNPTIGHQHAFITVDANGKIFIKDNNSKNGTYIISTNVIGQIKLTRLASNKQYPVNPGTVVRFANEDFTILKK